MSVTSRIRTALGLQTTPLPYKAAQAMQLADEVTDSANELNARLTTYSKAHDPFAALLADLYTQRQLQDVWKGRTR